MCGGHGVVWWCVADMGQCDGVWWTWGSVVVCGGHEFNGLRDQCTCWWFMCGGHVVVCT